MVNKKVEELVLEQDVPQVDIIISEWMGYCLLYEGMLDSVLYARDHFLVKGGLIFPEHGRIYVAAINDSQYKLESDSFYDASINPYGVSMKMYKEQKSSFVSVDRIEPHLIISNECKIFDVDINTCKVDDLQFSSEYHLRIKPQPYKHRNWRQDISGLVMWFEVDFPIAPEMPEEKRIVLSTSPFAPFTHWKHQLLYFQGDALHSVCVGEDLHGSLALRKNPEDIHDIEIKMSMHFQ